MLEATGGGARRRCVFSVQDRWAPLRSQGYVLEIFWWLHGRRGEGGGEGGEGGISRTIASSHDLTSYLHIFFIWSHAIFRFIVAIPCHHSYPETYPHAYRKAYQHVMFTANLGSSSLNHVSSLKDRWTAMGSLWKCYCFVSSEPVVLLIDNKQKFNPGNACFVIRERSAPAIPACHLPPQTSSPIFCPAQHIVSASSSPPKSKTQG